MYLKESSRQFPQLSPCNIGEYVGVDITIKGKVYNIFISEYNQKLYCMFCLDRNDKNYSNLPLKKAMDQPDFDKLSAVVNDYLNQYDEKVCSTGDGYFVRFEKGQYDDAFLFYLDVVRTFVERQ